MTDSGVGLGDTATVTDEKGNSIGTGTIYIHQPLQVTGTAGSISEVNVSEDEAVDSGDTLLTLDETVSQQVMKHFTDRERHWQRL